MMKGTIYGIINKVNGKYYIGQTIQEVKVRWKFHIGALRKNNHNSYLQNAWNKYGEENFEFKVLLEIEEDNSDLLLLKLNDLETKYIDIYHAMYYDNGYNLREGGRNGKMSPESRAKMSEAHKGEKNHFHGKTHTLETRDKISKANKCRVLPQEVYDKIGKANKGRKHTEQARQNMSNAKKGEKNPNYGKKVWNSGKAWSEEVKRKNAMSQIKLTVEQVIEAHKRLLNGEQQTSVAKDYGVTKKVIFNVKHMHGVYGEIIKEYEQQHKSV